MEPPDKKIRKSLSAHTLFRTLRSSFDTIPDVRIGKPQIALTDALMSAFAMFSLKDPSLLAFDERCRNDNDNFRTIYGIENLPSDSQMRAILDPVDPDHLRPAFTEIFRRLQRGKVMEDFVFLDNCYLLALDGTGYFSSSKIHCDSCIVKHHRGGTVSYSHQLLGAAIVHPNFKVVIPLTPEPIIQQDGTAKNDCERNATRRWLKRFRQEYPHLKVIIVEDALSSNAPHLCDLREARAHFILGVKWGDHAFLFRHLREADAANKTHTLTQTDSDTGILHHFRWHHHLPLNESNADELVHVVEYWELHADGKHQYFSWITDILPTANNVDSLMRGGRARWKIENETFNTLKNQGYHLEHNFGHGEQNLSVVFVLLMMLAFLVDQVQQHCCPIFQAARKQSRTRRYFWESIRYLFEAFLFASYTDLLQARASGIDRQQPILRDSS